MKIHSIYICCLQPTITVAYNLTHLIYYFSKAPLEVNIDDFLFHLNYFPCICSNSPYVDKDHGHYVTAGLRLMKNNKLFCKGPNFMMMKSTSAPFPTMINV